LLATSKIDLERDLKEVEKNLDLIKPPVGNKQFLKFFLIYFRLYFLSDIFKNLNDPNTPLFLILCSHKEAYQAEDCSLAQEITSCADARLTTIRIGQRVIILSWVFFFFFSFLSMILFHVLDFRCLVSIHSPA
jgi:hypothetical protein